MTTLIATLVTLTIVVLVEMNVDTAVNAVCETLAPRMTEIIINNEVFVMASPWLRLPQWVGYVVTLVELIEKFSN